jgi:hypothetical protein
LRDRTGLFFLVLDRFDSPNDVSEHRPGRYGKAAGFIVPAALL